MASTFTDNIGLEKQATGENENTWGTKWNAVLTTLDSLIGGLGSKALSDGDTSMVLSETLYQILEFTGALTATRTVTLPVAEMVKHVRNLTAATLIFNTAIGVDSTTVPAYREALIYQDASGNIYPLLSAGPLAGDWEQWLVNAAPGAAITLDTSLYPGFKLTLDNNTVITLDKPAGTGYATAITLMLVQDATGNRLPTFAGTVNWPGGVDPTFSTGVGDVDLVGLITVDGGTTWSGYIIGLDFA
jgi:hypothetical protein